MSTVPKQPIFGTDNIEREIHRLTRNATPHKWKSPSGEQIEVSIPPTVYQPREDTDLIAKSIMNLGPGKNRNCLEIGCGSGVLSIFASRQGWNVTACDINPFAVAATRGSAEENLVNIEVFEGGPSPKVDGNISQWTGGKKFDLIFWNLPYLKYDAETPETLGPMEEAALLDTDDSGLIEHALNHINNGLLTDSGIALFVISNNQVGLKSKFKCYSKGLAVRTISKLDFDDGEQLQVIGVWKPFVNCEKIIEESIASTNTTLLESNYKVGTSICTQNQTSGHGRRGRTWVDSKRSFAGSWKLFDGRPIISPGILQMIVGLCVKEAIQCIVPENIDEQVVLKWPNDVMIKFDGEWKKVCGILVESRSSGSNPNIIVGIGLNFAPNIQHNHQFPIGFLENYSKEFTFHGVGLLLDSIISSYFEENNYVSNLNMDELKQTLHQEVKLSFNLLGKSFYRNKEVVFNNICDDGKIEICDSNMQLYTIDDGESITWKKFN